jgi:tRNA (guanine6-N2)-methyltransferase
MPNRQKNVSLPACFAQVVPGLEPIAAEEITTDLGGEIKKKAPGAVIFRLDEISPSLLELRTTEDVFLLAWGTDQLSYRAQDLESIRRWTARDADWANLLRIHHAIRPKPKGKPTFRLVTQMHEQHGYRRVDAREALAKGLAGKLPASWKHAEENASVEIWLIIHGRTALCGVRLSDRTMRHRKYKMEHIPASLRPTVAAAMVRLARAQPTQTILDPLCGAGTILAEVLEWRRTSSQSVALGEIWGGDEDTSALRAAASNLRRLGPVRLARWDALHLPFSDSTVDCILSNPPFGKQLERPEGIRSFYKQLVKEMDRVLRPQSRAVLLISDFPALKEAAEFAGWNLQAQHRLQVLGQQAALTVWRKRPS